MNLNPGSTIIADTRNSQYFMTVMDHYPTDMGIDLLKVDVVGGSQFPSHPNPKHKGPTHVMLIAVDRLRVGESLLFLPAVQTASGSRIQTSPVSAISFFDENGKRINS